MGKRGTMRKRTASEACIEYAIAAQAVREQTRIMGNNRCVEESAEEIEHAAGRLVSPAVPSCLTQHWEIVVGKYREEPALALEDMCEKCQIRLEAFEARKVAKKRLGAAKRSVEAIGKRESNA